MRIRMRMSAINELISRHNVPWLMCSNRSAGVPQAFWLKFSSYFDHREIGGEQH